MWKKLKLDELGRKTVEEFKKSQKQPIIIVLDNVRSMHNVGSIFRTCDSFAIEKLYLCGITPTPPHREILKTALGATESVEWEYIKDCSELIPSLKSVAKVIGIEQTTGSIALDKLPLPESEKVVLIFGNEVEGIQDSVLSMCDLVVEVPQWGTKHSLNVSVCAGVVIWEFAKQFHVNN